MLKVYLQLLNFTHTGDRRVHSGTVLHRECDDAAAAGGELHSGSAFDPGDETESGEDCTYGYDTVPPELQPALRQIAERVGQLTAQHLPSPVYALLSNTPTPGRNGDSALHESSDGGSDGGGSGSDGSAKGSCDASCRDDGGSDGGAGVGDGVHQRREGGRYAGIAAAGAAGNARRRARRHSHANLQHKPHRRSGAGGRGDGMGALYIDGARRQRYGQVDRGMRDVHRPHDQSRIRPADSNIVDDARDTFWDAMHRRTYAGASPPRDGTRPLHSEARPTHDEGRPPHGEAGQLRGAHGGGVGLLGVDTVVAHAASAVANTAAALVGGAQRGVAVLARPLEAATHTAIQLPRSAVSVAYCRPRLLL